MKIKTNSQKKITNEKKEHLVAFKSDQSMLNMIEELKLKLELDNDSQVIRFALKKLHRKEILNNKQVA